MCGILGISHYGISSSVESALLSRMRDAMQHRGPDDAGLWIDPKGIAGLAHRRLSIIDLSADGHQPMANEDDSLHITFNGEIYNYQELRPDLGRKGHILHSTSDTEVILHLYEDLGPACVERLDGMFAFGIWDSRRKTWFLARDRLGVKPLYYTMQQGMFIFASEIKSILAHPRISPELDSEALGHYLTFKTTPGPSTMFSGIRKLPAGCTLQCDANGNMSIVRYWDAVSIQNQPIARCDEAEAVETVRELFSKSVKKRMVADVPVGAFLSGGLDSSGVVGLMASQSSGPVHTFSIGIKDLEGHNEFEYAREVSTRFGTEHHEICISQEDVQEYLPRLVHTQDEPLADPVCVPLYYVSKLAVDSGIKVVQVGEGSDEQFLGYDSRIEFLRRYRRTWQPLLSLPTPALKGLHAAAVLAGAVTKGRSRYEQVLARAARGEEPFLGSIAFGEQDKRELLSSSVSDCSRSQHVVEGIISDLRGAWPRTDIATRMMYIDLKIRLAELLLMRVDKVTMSVALEAREPFMDYRLVEYTMRLPRSLKLKGWNAKHLLKRALKEVVPDSVIRRPKRAFAAPVNEWLRHGLGEYAKSLIMGSSIRRENLFQYPAIERMLDFHHRGEADYGVQIWNLMNLSAWYDQWISAKSIA